MGEIKLILGIVLALFLINLTSALNCEGEGGILTYNGEYCVHTFLTNGSFNVTSEGNISFLIVAGGGAGGGSSVNTNTAGGGAGGVVFSGNYTLSAGNWSVVVGVGGTGVPTTGNNGTNSSFAGFIAIGGGGGGEPTPNGNGMAGGSGGGSNNGLGGRSPGATIQPNYTGAISYGNSGGGNASNFNGNGGGGAGANGTSGNCGTGGIGMNFTIYNGTALYYGGGGGGSAVTGCVGGLGGGGTGVYPGTGGAGTVNTGGGGGAGGGTGISGGAGGSGIVIISYLQEVDTIPPNTTIPIINSTDLSNKSNQDLNCYATLTDDQQTNLIANWTWYKNDAANLSGSTPVINGTFNLITTLSSGNIIKGEQWKCEVLPFDGYNYGNSSNSTSITILNSPSSHSQPLLKTQTGKNLSTEDLICYNQSTSDADNDNITNIYNWYKDSQSLLFLNLPLEINANDYSGNNNNGAIYGANFIEGKYGKALNFDGINDYILIQDSNSTDFINKKTWELWFKRNTEGAETLFDKGDSNSNYKLEFLDNNELKFSYSVIPGISYYSWQVDDKADFDEGDYNQTLFNTDANILTLNATSIEQQIFFDGFESGSFAANNWVAYANSVNWSVSTNAPFEGTYHAEIIDTGGAGDRSTIEVNISTLGFANINISYAVQRIGLDAGDDFTAEYFNGTNYTILESEGTANDPAYQNRSFLLPSDANNNPDFKIRFSCVGAGPGEGCRIDNVELRGNGSGFVSSGEYTSKVLNSGKISEWINLTWQEELTTNADLVFQIRSCDDSTCSGETFVGPDNTSNTNFTNPNFNNISFIEDNQYFQFKAFFSTINFGVSPNLSEVSVSYSQTINSNEINITSTTAITDNEWHLVTITYEDNNLSLYINNTLEASKIEASLPAYKENNLTIAKFFNGSIDEFRIYNEALTLEQIQTHYNLEYNTIVNEETSGGDVYMCQITPNDAEEDGATLNSTSLNVLWGITFNVTYGEDGSQESNFNIDCDNGFSVSGVNSPYTAGFEPGSYVCVFTKPDRYDRTIIFTAESDKTVNVKLSRERQLTIEEHTWLEAIYNCLYQGDCSLYNLLLEINQTVGNIWEHTKPTDGSVVTFENVTNKIVNSTNNLTINYTVSIPIKAGYAAGTYLPVRIGYWFLDENNETCYSQGDKPTGVEEPYCQPLVIETIGPMGGSISFIVEMQPSLPSGNYNIKRIIDIDPNNVWINYGQETLGIITLTESLLGSGISLEKTGETIPSSSQPSQSSSSGGGGSSVTNVYNTYVTEGEENEKSSEAGEKEQGGAEVSKEEVSGSSWITGGVIGANLLSRGSIVVIVALLCSTFIIFIIVRYKTIIILKKKQ